MGLDLHECFKNLAIRTGCELQVDFLDPGGALLDWSKTQTWEATVQQARKRAWDLCLMFPPCGAYSRARHRQDGKSGGPKPLRARGFLHGFPWLAKQHRAAVDHEDFVIAKCFNLITILSELKVGWILVHPEDLGKMRGGETPASLWQWEEVQSILDNRKDAKSWVEHMCAYGAASAHPTRVLTNLSGGPDHMGLPRFDGDGWYLGPLGKCGHVHVSSVGRAEQEWTTKSSLPAQFFDELAVLAFEWVQDDRATDHSFQGAEDFADWLLDQNRGLVQHEGEALCRLLPFEQPHVAAAGANPGQGRAFFSGAFCKGPFYGLRQSCHQFPQSIKCLTALLRDAFPGRVFSSLAVFDNVAARMHKDSRNAPFPNLLLALTCFQHGEVWCEASAGTEVRQVQGVPRRGILLPVADSPQTLQAHEVFHQTEPWTGDRMLLVGYTTLHTSDLSSDQRNLLNTLGFVLPSGQLKEGGEEGRDNLTDTTPYKPGFNTPRHAATSGASRVSSTPSGGSTQEAPVSTPEEGTTPQAPHPTQATADSGGAADESTAQACEPAQVIEVPSSEDHEEEAEGFDAATSRCRGPAIRCRHTKEWRELIDGFGLCSPGRWRPLARDATATSHEWGHAEAIRELLHKTVRKAIKDPRAAAFALATGRLKVSPFDDSTIREVRSQIAAMLPDPTAAMEVPPGQPFMLHMLSQSLEVLGDPDFEILDHGSESFAEGVPLGWDKPITRTPQVFPKRTVFRKLDQSDFDPSMLNYRSAELNAEQLEAKFREDERAGLMVCTTEAEAKRVYGDTSLLIAAMGAVTKANGDVRPLHDGTHGINLNNKIKILDKLQVPGPEDLQEVASRVKESREAPFALCADIKQAHRNVKVRESDWPRLACKSSSSSRVLWLNRVGTFGVSSAAYYWTRLFAAVGRWAFRVLHLDKFYMLIYVDDLHVVVFGGEKFYTLWALFLALEIMGTPFAYHKFKGGLAVDYIGYHLDYFS